ncbi:MAG: hypothetical protein ACYC8T_12485 [Myxococcaceae bacterium]
MRRALMLLPLLCACGAPQLTTPSEQEVEDAKARVQQSLDSAQQARTALELLGILPTYGCGESRAIFIGKAVANLQLRLGCVTVTTEAQTDSDVAVVSFADAGCKVGEHSVKGKATFRYSGGEDRLDLEADFREVVVNGKPLGAKVGYGTCGDEKRYWAYVEGELPTQPPIGFLVDVRVGKRDGLPIIGSTTLILDGTLELRQTVGTDKVTMTALTYEVGEYGPQEGTLLVETSSGHRIQTTFVPKLWRTGKAEVTIDSHEMVTVPVIH